MTGKEFLGKKFRDRVSGFEGVCTGYHEWLTGCSTVSLQPAADKDGKYSDTVAFDVVRLELVYGDAVEIDTSGDPGGPQCTPSPSNGQR